MGNLSGESREQNRKDKVTRFRSVTYNAPRVGGAPQLSKSTHLRKFGNHVTVHRATERPSEPQGKQCLLSHFLASLGAQENTNCTSML